MYVYPPDTKMLREQTDENHDFVFFKWLIKVENVNLCSPLQKCICFTNFPFSVGVTGLTQK